MTAIQYVISREAERLRKFPEARYRGWENIISASERLFEERGPRRPIPLTEAERRQEENRKRKQRRDGTELQKALDRLRAAGYSIKAPKSDEDLDARAEEWLEGYVKHG